MSDDKAPQKTITRNGVKHMYHTHKHTQSSTHSLLASLLHPVWSQPSTSSSCPFCPSAAEQLVEAAALRTRSSPCSLVHDHRRPAAAAWGVQQHTAQDHSAPGPPLPLRGVVHHHHRLHHHHHQLWRCEVCAATPAQGIDCAHTTHPITETQMLMSHKHSVRGPQQRRLWAVVASHRSLCLSGRQCKPSLAVLPYAWHRLSDAVTPHPQRLKTPIHMHSHSHSPPPHTRTQSTPFCC